MSKFQFIPAVLFGSLITLTGTKANHSPSSFLQLNQKPDVKFDTLWVNYNIWREGKKGMLIHMKFTVYNMKNVACKAAIYFEFDEDWPLEDKNKKFSDGDGNVAVFQSLQPAYTETIYNDLQLFMPYEELDLAPGKYELSMDADIEYVTGGEGRSKHLTYFDFVYTQPSAAVSNTTKTSNIDLEKFWVDYDITESGRYGMRIHAKLVVANMNGTSSYLAAFFSTLHGVKLESASKGFRSADGQLAVYKIIEPKYDESIYDDIRLFLPYSELNLPAGKHRITITLAFLDKDGNRIKTLKDYYFVYTKN